MESRRGRCREASLWYLAFRRKPFGRALALGGHGGSFGRLQRRWQGSLLTLVSPISRT